MNRRISLSVSLTITLIAMTLTFALTVLYTMSYFNNSVSSVLEKQAQYNKLAEIDTYVRHNYYGDIDDTYLNDRIARGYIDGINDRYSTYYSAQDYLEMQEYERGERVRVGLEMVLGADGFFRVTRVFSDSPADKAGVKTGVRITAIDGEPIASGATVRAVQNRLGGQVGTTVDLTCLDGAEEVTYEIQRVSYPVVTLEYKRSGSFGYFRIYSFGANTASNFDFYLNQALREGVKGIVIDVRGNNSAEFAEAYTVIDRLCPSGTIAWRLAKNGTKTVLATSDEDEAGVPLTVLVDANTGAAAELLAASVRNMAGGRVVGVKTLGRGTLQSQPQQLTDGSAISITTAILLDSSGESFDGVGIVPDVEVTTPLPDEALLYNPTPAQDPHILRALEVVRSLLTTENADELPLVNQPGAEVVGSVTDVASGDGGDASAFLELGEGEAAPAEESGDGESIDAASTSDASASSTDEAASNADG